MIKTTTTEEESERDLQVLGLFALLRLGWQEFGGDVGNDTTLRDDHRTKELVQPFEEEFDVRQQGRASEDACMQKETHSSSFLMASCK